LLHSSIFLDFSNEQIQNLVDVFLEAGSIYQCCSLRENNEDFYCSGLDHLKEALQHLTRVLGRAAAQIQDSYE